MMITHDGLNAQTAKAPKKMLVAYFSHSGNTRTVAEQIREATGADIFEIEPAAAYPTNYQAVVDQAKKEVNSGFKPALKSKPRKIRHHFRRITLLVVHDRAAGRDFPLFVRPLG